MIELPKMIMIGSAGRKAGKTKLACELIRKWKTGHDIVGIKVTTIKRKDGACPYGGEGCGVCSSLQGNYLISEETNAPYGASIKEAVPLGTASDKDTSQLLAAGAKRVFWLRVLEDHLQEGFNALLQVMGNNTICVCESNSLRQVVKPGVYIILKNKNSDEFKSSAQRFKDITDRIINFDGKYFDMELSDLVIEENGWVLHQQKSVEHRA